MALAPASNRSVAISDNLTPDHWLDEKFEPFSGNLTDHEITVANELPEVISDDDTVGRWQDIYKTIDGEGKKIEGLRIEMKEPFLQGGRKVDGEAKNLTDRVTRLKFQIGGVIKRYLDEKAATARREAEERARKLREEEESKRQEADAARQRAEDATRKATVEKHTAVAELAEDAANLAGTEAFEVEATAAAKPADFARTRSLSGTLGTLAQSWDFRIDDIAAVKGAKLWHLVSRAEKERVIRQFIKQNAPLQLKEGEDWQPIDGVTMFPTTKLQVR